MHRSIMDSAMWESEPFSRSQAWIDMLMLANHKPGVIFRRGVKVEIPRGGIGKSIRTLAERWSWSHGKVERFFSFLLDEEMVKKVGTKKTSVDTCYYIVNYEKYQDCGDEDGVEDGKKTGRRREEDGDGTRREEGKKDIYLPTNGSADNCPQKEIIELYHQTLPVCPKVNAWGKTLQANLRTRWKESVDRQSLHWWKSTFEEIAKSDFLMGRIQTQTGPFLFSLGWFVGPKNFEKVLNGQYANRSNGNQGQKIGGLTF